MKTVNYLLRRFALILSVCLYTLSSAYAQHQDDIVDRLNKTLGVMLPDEYLKPVKAFVQSNEIMHYQIAGLFTEQFIEEQMKASWGIDRQNQLLFVWDAIYEQVAEKNFYDGEDGNQKRLDDFVMALDSIEACGKKYRKELVAEFDRQSAEYDRQSAEARQQSAEARQQSAEYDRQSAEYDRQSAEAVKNIMSQDSAWVKEHMPEFYDIYTTNPNVIKQEDLTFVMEATKGFIADCKKRGIDYRAILMKELGDKKKVEEMLKFYGVE